LAVAYFLDHPVYVYMRRFILSCRCTFVDISELNLNWIHPWIGLDWVG